MTSQQHHESNMTATTVRNLDLGDDTDPVRLAGVECVVHEGQKGVAAFYGGRTEDGHGFISNDGWSAAPAYSWRVVAGGKRKLGTDDVEGGGRREDEQEAANNADQRNEKGLRRVPKECRDLIKNMIEDSDSDVTLAKGPISIPTTATYHPTPYGVTMNNPELRVRRLERKVENLNRARSRVTNPKKAQDVENSNTNDVVTKRTKFCGAHAPKKRKKRKESVGCT